MWGDPHRSGLKEPLLTLIVTWPSDILAILELSYRMLPGVRKRVGFLKMYWIWCDGFTLFQRWEAEGMGGGGCLSSLKVCKIKELIMLMSQMGHWEWMVHMWLVFRIEEHCQDLQQRSNLPGVGAPKAGLPTHNIMNREVSVLEVWNFRGWFHQRSREEAKHEGKIC